MNAENPFRDYVIYDHIESCPYLPDREARMPLRMPSVEVEPEECDQRLALGERRSGRFVYKTRCDNCQACEPIRLPVQDFMMNRSQRRAFNRGQREIDVRQGKPVVDQSRVDLFNKHRNQRGLAHDGMDIDLSGYSSFLVESCFNTFEFAYYVNDELMGVAICDQGSDSMSAVYCFYDPAYAKLSPGVFSVLYELDYCRRNGLTWLYLGFYIAESPHMSYKKSYRPHQRLINERWVVFD